MDPVTRRGVLVAGGVAAASLALKAAAADDAKAALPKGNDCIVKLQMRGVDLSTKEKCIEAMKQFSPIIAEELWTCNEKPRSRGCSVSGTVSGGSGGFGGSGTVTCTF